MGDLSNTVMSLFGAPTASSSGSDWNIDQGEQRNRDQERLKVFDYEISQEKDPDQLAALQRQRNRIAQGLGAPAQPVTPQQSVNSDGLFNTAMRAFSEADNRAVPPSSSSRNPAIDSIPVPDSPEWNALPGGGVNAEKPETSSIGDKLIGAGEAGLNMLTSIPAAIPGAIAGIGNMLTNGKYGTQQGVSDAGKAFSDTADKFTYAPRTEAGRTYAGAVGNAINDSGIIGIAPLSEVGTIAESARPAAAYAKNGAAAEIKQMFSDRGGDPVASRLEPTLPGAKPRVKLNADGSVTPMGSGASESPAPSYAPPSIENASQQVKKYVADNPKMSDAEVARHVEADSLPVPARLTQGQGSQDVHQISFEQNNKGKNQELGTLMNQQNQNLIDNMNAIREKAAPDVHVTNPVDAGQAIVDSYKKMDNTLKADISAKYQALKDANGGQFPLDAKAFVDNADQALHQGLLYDHVPASIRSTLDRLKDGGQMTFENFESLRTNLARLQRSPTLDGNAQAAAGVIRNALEDVPMPPGAENLKPLADQARSAARARFQLIDSDPAYAAASKDDAAVGEPSPLSDKFIENYVINGKRANVQNMIKNLSADPQAKQVIAAGVLDHLKTKSGVDLYTNAGNVSQAGYNRALSNIRPKMDLVFDPETAQNVQRVGNVARYQQFQPRGSYVNNSNTLTGAAAELAKSGAEVGTNMAFGGIPVGSAIRKASQYVGKTKQVQKSLGPAGLTKLSEFP